MKLIKFKTQSVIKVITQKLEVMKSNVGNHKQKIISRQSLTELSAGSRPQEANMLDQN